MAGPRLWIPVRPGVSKAQPTVRVSIPGSLISNRPRLRGRWCGKASRQVVGQGFAAGGGAKSPRIRVSGWVVVGLPRLRDDHSP